MKDYIFIDQDINVLKEEMKTSKKLVFNRLVEQCKLYFNEQIPDEHPKSSSTFMGMAMANLSLAYLLTGQDHYKEEAKRWIFKVVNYPHWGNAHLVDVDLSAAWILFGLGISYDWLENVLLEEEKQLIKDKLILQGNRMYDYKKKTEGSGWSTNYFQNHNWINLCGLSAAGYALINEYDEAKEWIEDSKDNFNTVYSMMPEDGSDYEGVVYWRYGAMWLFVYAHLLKEREGINYFKSCKFLENTFGYRLYQAAPNLEEQVNFGDCHDRRSGHSTAIYYKVASEYNNGYAQKLGNLVRDKFLYREAYESKVKPGILPECFFEVLFFNPEVEEKPFDELPLRKFFPDLGLYVTKTSWEKDAMHFSFKCGHPGGKTQWKHLWRLKEEQNYNCFGLSHQHPDNNSFILIADNTYFAIDDGYNRHVEASDHNVVIVDGKGYEDEGQNNIWRNYTQDMVAEIEVCDITDDYSYVVGETSKQYQKDLNLTCFKRHIMHTEKPYIVMLDELESTDEHIYTWIMYSDLYPKYNDAYIYENGHGKMSVHHYSDTKTESEFIENSVKAVMTTQEPDKYTEIKMKGLYLSNTEKKKKVTFLNVLVPTKDEVIVKHLDLDGGYGVSVTFDNETEIYIYSEGKSVKYNNEIYNSKLVLIKEVDGKKVSVFNLSDD